MFVSFTLEQRFCCTADGAVWTPDCFAYAVWNRYLAVFDGVRVLARVLSVDRPPEGSKRVDGPGVLVAELPYYVGPLQYAMKRSSLSRELCRVMPREDAVILRVPSPIGTLAARHLQRRGQPYSVEVVGDPWDLLAYGGVRHPLCPLLKWLWPRDLRRVVAGAAAATYVTEHALQRRYPPADGARVAACSDVELPPAAFAPARTYDAARQTPVRLISVGTLAQMYKAPDVVVEAVARCVRDGINVELAWVGDGQCRQQVEERARETGYVARFHFLGSLPGAAAVRNELDRADLFVLASRQEGLPRAMVEAMARGLPCIGSTVGGIPELLPADCLVPPNDPEALARTIAEIARSPDRMEAMSRRNLEKAQEYRDEALSKRRTEFYRYVREATERWLTESRRRQSAKA
jgi:glycosyltransferase involved in cell wall biosynthesis